jgi:hypothetical protein
MVLKQLLHDFDWLPRTFGVPVVPRFINVVVVPPECLIRRDGGLTWILHMDELVTKARWDIHVGSIVVNLIHNHSGHHAQLLGKKLVSLHKPFRIDYQDRFGIAKPRVVEPKQVKRPSGYCCENCEKPISNAEVPFCHENDSRFAGKALCRKCQGYIPAVIKESPTSTARPISKPHCAECDKVVSPGVAEFCHDNKNGLGGRVLCMACQRRFKNSI